MTIERIHFEDGIPVSRSESPERILMSNLSKAVVLAEGNYDLTPAWWTKNLMRHKLEVLGDGNGIYRAIPRDNDVGFSEVGHLKFGPHSPGGKTVYLPKDEGIFMVGGPLKDRKTIGIYEIIFHIPGPSPRK